MKQMFRKVLSLFIVSIFLLTSVTSSFAASSENDEVINYKGNTVKIDILTDNSKMKKVKTDDGKFITFATYDKRNNTIEIKEINKQTGEQTKTETDLNNINVPKEDNLITTKAYLLRSKASRFFKVKYFIYSNDYWSIYNSSGTSKYRYESTTRATNLANFKSAVDRTVSNEVQAITAGGAVVAATIMGAVTAPTGLGTFIAAGSAVGASMAVIYNLWEAWDCSLDADYYWYKVG